jgi:hypothetical protein
MSGDFSLLPSISNAAIGKVGDLLTFSFPEVLEVVKQCATNEIAVLGVEVLRVRTDGYYTEALSTYDLQPFGRADVERAGWVDYVRLNNSSADEFIRLNPTGDDHVYVLTTASWREFREIQQIKRR